MSLTQDKIAGTQPGEVIDLLQQRFRDYASEHHDNRKLGLVVEGGGMRGVLSAGSLLALDLLGYRRCFDAVFAVSAGSVNAAYFLSGQGETGISVYFDDISSRRFINPFRLWKIADVDYVYDYVVPVLKPLDESAIRHSPQEFYVTATDVQTGSNTLLDVKRSMVPITRLLKASSAIPVLYNRSVHIGGHEYVDGGLSGGLPIDWARKQGCTDLLILLSRPCSYLGKPPGRFERLIFRIALGHRHPSLYRTFLQAPSVKETNRREALGSGSFTGMNIATLCPDATEDGVQRTTIDRRKLLEGAYASAAKVYRLLGGEIMLLEKTFQGFR